jgi:hypothetical protein
MFTSESLLVAVVPFVWNPMFTQVVSNDVEAMSCVSVAGSVCATPSEVRTVPQVAEGRPETLDSRRIVRGFGSNRGKAAP